MPKRKIETGIGTYQNKDGHWTFGVLGEEVSVHKDDVERFDRLNVTGAAESAPVIEEIEEPTPTESATAAAPEPSTPAEPAVPEPYEGVNVKDLKALLVTRNEGREDADKIRPAEPGNRAEIVAALVADDAKQQS